MVLRVRLNTPGRADGVAGLGVNGVYREFDRMVWRLDDSTMITAVSGGGEHLGVLFGVTEQLCTGHPEWPLQVAFPSLACRYLRLCDWAESPSVAESLPHAAHFLPSGAHGDVFWWQLGHANRHVHRLCQLFSNGAGVKN